MYIWRYYTRFEHEQTVEGYIVVGIYEYENRNRYIEEWKGERKRRNILCLAYILNTSS